MREWLEDAAVGWSLSATRLGTDLVLSRSGMSFALKFEPVDSPNLRQQLLATMMGIRLGIDRLTTSYGFDQERPVPAVSNRRHEAPSYYGERLPRLVLNETIATLEEITQIRPVVTPWGTHAGTIYVREWRKEWHTFAERDFSEVDFERTNLTEFARYALFNDVGTQKSRPQVDDGPFGRLKTYVASDGLVSARATLMPEFDPDFEASQGCFCVPAYDTMIVGSRSGQHGELRLEVMARAREAWRTSHRPFLPVVFDATGTPTNSQWQVDQGRLVSMRRLR